MNKVTKYWDTYEHIDFERMKAQGKLIPKDDLHHWLMKWSLKTSTRVVVYAAMVLCGEG
jgi:hypothetical protein